LRAGPEQGDGAGVPTTAALAREAELRRLLRARDAMDRGYREALDIPALARVALLSEAHFVRRFGAAFGETPHRYLQRRRIERATALLRDTDDPVTDVCLAVGFTSLGTFSRTFSALLGVSPSVYRARCRGRGVVTYAAPTCAVRAWTRPSDAVLASSRDVAADPSKFGEARAVTDVLASRS
jgi:transcriptional regulator GlxA family with amidase domain